MPKIDMKRAGLALPGTPEFAADGNVGLYYEKYFDTLDPPRRGRRDTLGALNRWINGIGKIDRSRIGNAALLAEACEVMRCRVDRLGGETVFARSLSPLAAGLGAPHPIGSGLSWHPTLGLPYVPASSVKGAFLAWLKDWRVLRDPDATEEAAVRQEAALLALIFGRAPRRADDAADDEEAHALVDGHVGSVIFFDALPCAPVSLVAEVMTPHYGPWYQQALTAANLRSPPADWYKLNPFGFAAVASGALFCFGLARRPTRDDNPRSLTDDDFADVTALFREFLCEGGLGAKTALGYGQFALSDPPGGNAPSPTGER